MYLKKKKKKKKKGIYKIDHMYICNRKNHNALRQHVMKIKIEIFIKPVEISHFDWLVNLVLRICREKIKKFL